MRSVCCWSFLFIRLFRLCAATLKNVFQVVCCGENPFFHTLVFAAGSLHPSPRSEKDEHVCT